MHCGLKNWKGKSRLNIDIYHIPTVLAFTLADMKVYSVKMGNKNPCPCSPGYPKAKEKTQPTVICCSGMLQMHPSKFERLKGLQFWS